VALVTQGNFLKLRVLSKQGVTTVISSSKFKAVGPKVTDDLFDQRDETSKSAEINANPMENRNDQYLVAFLTLNAVAVIWGTQHAVIKSSISSFHSTSLLNFWRFSSSALLFSPAFVATVKDWCDQNFYSPSPPSSPSSSSSPNSVLVSGAELGLYTFLGFALQAIGLETTSATRSAFLLYLNVKFVPIFAAILFGRKVSLDTWISAFLAFSGTALLANDNGPPVIGDLYCIGAAAASALFILRLETFSKQNNAARLNGVSFVVVALLCGVWAVGDYIFTRSFTEGGEELGLGLDVFVGDFLSFFVNPMLQNPLPVLYLGIISTALCNYLQTLGQRVISAPRAAVIYSLDPVYGAFFSWLLLGETIGSRGFAGGVLILLGVFFSSKASVPFTSNDQKENEM